MRIIFIFLLFLQLFACSDSSEIYTQCRECEPINFSDSVSLDLFQVFNHSDKILAIALKEPNETYRICNEDMLLEIEDTKIIEVEGGVFIPCNDSLRYNFLEIFDFTLIETCPYPIDTLSEKENLLGTWYFINIISENDTIVPPCEAISPHIRFYIEENQYFLDAFTGENSCITRISLEDSRVNVLENLTCTLSLAPTEAVRQFERLFGLFMNCPSFPCGLKFTVTNNFITIANDNENITANFYSK